jgi:N-acetylglucosaminyldiphosphoundecaprenol N-acetyl-beta-D-mannosaminyltransferase
VDDVCFDNITGSTALSIIQHYLADQDQVVPRVVFFVNVHSVHIAHRHHGLRYALHRADLVLPDGSGLELAGKVYKRPISENLNGTDFIPRVLRELAASGRSAYFLGAQRRVLDACLRRVPELFPGLKVAGSRHGHFSDAEEPEVIAAINAVTPDVLLVAMGTPSQEEWIVRNLPNLNTRVCFGVGGLFDFLSGEKRRAPGWIRSLGLEWIFRFAHAPSAKWDRVLLEIPLFVLRTLMRRISVTSLSIRSHTFATPSAENEE